ncbi:MAG: hypothetical protein AAGI51_18405, partial [Pseudomonadota bacterium]
RGAQFATSLAQSAFPDEFARQDAKTAFFAEYYDGILARRPAAPLPLLHKAPVQVGSYDFDAQAFPLQGLEGAVLRVAGTLAHQPDPWNRREAGLHSVDRISGLPTALPMPPDQARLLRDALAAAASQGRGRLTLAWWSDLDWTRDGQTIEALMTDARWQTTEGRMPAGRATLKRIAIFLDEGLTQPLMEIDPQAVLTPLPQPEVVDPATRSALARIEAAEPAQTRDLMAAVARAMGGGEAVWTALAERTTEVQAANEFDRPAVTRTAVAALQARPEGPVWLAGRATLAGYDLASESFAFQEGSGYVRFTLRGDRGEAQITPVLVGPPVFERLPVDPQLAQALVEASGDDRRQVSFVLRAEPMNAVDPRAGDPRRAGQAYELRLRAMEAIFYTPDVRGRGPAEVLAALDYQAENRAADARRARVFAAEDFAEVSQAAPVIDAHVLDLLALKAGGPPPRGDGLAAAMISAAAHEAGADALPGPRFFEDAASPPQGPEAELLRPAFHSYLAAKAEALGARFIARAWPASTRECAQTARYEQTVVGSNAAVFQAVPAAYDDANQL